MAVHTRYVDLIDDNGTVTLTPENETRSYYFEGLSL